jgi:hypothetical protein
VIRTILSVVLSGACLAVGLWTTQIRAENHARAAHLDWIKRRCDLIEASNEGIEYSISIERGKLERRVQSVSTENSRGAIEE